MGYLDREEASTGNIDAVSASEVPDGSTNGGLELQNVQVALALFVCADCFFVGDDFHLQFMIIDDTLDGFQIEPDVVCVEILELFDALEFLDMIGWDLSDFQESDCSVVVDDGASLDIGLCLVCQFHNVLGFCVGHVFEDVQIDDGAEIVDVADEDDFFTAGNQCVERSAVGEGIKDVPVARRIPRFDGSIVISWDGEEGVFNDSGEAGLIECEDVNVMALVFLDDALGVVFGVERVHQDEGDITAVGAIQVLITLDTKNSVEGGTSI